MKVIKLVANGLGEEKVFGNVLEDGAEILVEEVYANRLATAYPAKFKKVGVEEVEKLANGYYEIVGQQFKPEPVPEPAEDPEGGSISEPVEQEDKETTTHRGLFGRNKKKAGITEK